MLFIEKNRFIALLTVQSSSVQDGIYALGKAHTCSTSSLRSFSNVAFQTVHPEEFSKVGSFANPPILMLAVVKR